MPLLSYTIVGKDDNGYAATVNLTSGASFGQSLKGRTQAERDQEVLLAVERVEAQPALIDDPVVGSTTHMVDIAVDASVNNVVKPAI